jgi:hypothetical protein
MNDTVNLEVRPDVAAFVAAVRDRLADLTEEEREELVGGLEADLAERLAEGESDLGDPAAYADELRAAAGLEVRRRTWSGRRATASMTLRDRTEAVLDGSRRRLEGLVADGRPASVWLFLVTLRPLWWFFRAWVAVQLLDLWAGPHDMPTIVPTLRGVVPGVAVTIAATVVSVQIGRGRWWPGRRVRTSPAARVLLLALNAFAVVMAPLVLGQFPGAGTPRYGDTGAVYSVPPAGLQSQGSYVTNVFPYDAQGRPLTGVQLFDQDGSPLTVGRDGRFDFGDVRVTTRYPWFNGDQKLWNVFPLPARTTRLTAYGPPRISDRAWASTNPPVLPTAPLAVVPPAVLPTPVGAEPQVRPSASASPTERSSAKASPSADSEKPRSR